MAPKGLKRSQQQQKRSQHVFGVPLSLLWRYRKVLYLGLRSLAPTILDKAPILKSQKQPNKSSHCKLSLKKEPKTRHKCQDKNYKGWKKHQKAECEID